jgi:hypothetical protein
MTKQEISLLVRSVLELCDRQGRQQIAGMAVISVMETFPPAERQVELANMMQSLSAAVNYINATPDWKNPGKSQ